MSKNMAMVDRVNAAEEFNSLVDEFEKEQAGMMPDGIDMNDLVMNLPRKMRRKIMNQNSFSNRFKRSIIKKP